MPKVTIMQEGMRKRAYIDEKEVSNGTRGIDVRIRPDEVPMVDFEMSFKDGFLELSDADVRIKIHPETLQEAAAIVRSEFLNRGVWYNALVASISSYIRDIPVDKEMWSVDLAKGIADRIIGLEDSHGYA